MLDHLRKVYGRLNHVLFSGDLPDCDFLLNLSVKRPIFLFHPPKGIHLCGRFLCATPIEILDDLVHVMVHVCNHQRHVEDFTSNKYHKMSFCHEALRVGLSVQRHRTRGWGITFSDPRGRKGEIRSPAKEASDKLRHIFREAAIPAVEFTEYQQQLMDSSRPQKEYTFRYVCGCNPPMIIRSGRRPDGPRPFKATCTYCNANFVLQNR